MQHILKLTRGLNEADQANKKAKIDSIYTVLKNGGDFYEIAKSRERGSRIGRNGGELDWFSTGRMVPEFEAASFALANGENFRAFANSLRLSYRETSRLETD